MNLKYKVMSTHQPGQGKDGDLVWFPKITGSSQVDLNGVINYLEKRTTVSGIDVQAVLYGLIALIPELLINGNTVKLADFGSFRLHAKVETASTKEEVTEKNIKELRMSFRPGRMMKDALKIASYQKVTK